MQFANWGAWVLLPVFAAAILLCIRHTRRGQELYIRRIPGVDAIEEVVGRAVELGRPVLFSIGLGSVQEMVTLQAISVIGHVAKLAARFRNRVIVPVVDPMTIPVIEEVQREAYLSVGQEGFNPDDVRFLSGDQFAYAAGVVGIMARENVGATFYFGTFYAESLIMAENGQAVGAAQIAATPSANQIPFFLASCDYTIIGEEYYATTALLSGDPVLKGSLVGQDFGKLAMLVLIVVGVVWTTCLGAPPDWLSGFLVTKGG